MVHGARRLRAAHPRPGRPGGHRRARLRQPGAAAASSSATSTWPSCPATSPTRGTWPRSARCPDDAVVVLVGSGLTAIDLAITLLEDSPRRRAVMVSRHGLLPHTHIEQQSTAWVSPLPPGELTADGLAEFVRGQVAAARRTASTGATCSTACARTPSSGGSGSPSRSDAGSCRRTPGTGRSAGTGWRPAVYDRINDYRKFGRLKVLAVASRRRTPQDGRALVPDRRRGRSSPTRSSTAPAR